MERNGTWTHVGLKRKILKNQEDAENLKITLSCRDGELSAMTKERYYFSKIVEQLKKRLDYFKTLPKKYPDKVAEDLWLEMISQFQKILKGKE